ncbi:MerR family transcriptional regulator [Salaquimonas pukyongi]|uniref:MerR family transcriptional regulator n=1 Tax=Salaquimonas pukyongi TaxID=2712698 RepID=UPI00096B87DE|nr:helix-turn-helix domain-containing protein [Salaquimonas pukyongi]
MLSIGELSLRAGVKVPTIRYYEQVGLIAAPERTEGNQRRYSKAELERLSFIRHARDLGLSIEAIRDLVHLSENPAMECNEAHAIAGAHLEAVESRLRKLTQLAGELQRIAASCEGGGTVGECHIIRALADHELCEGEH